VQPIDGGQAIYIDFQNFTLLSHDEWLDELLVSAGTESTSDPVAYGIEGEGASILRGAGAESHALARALTGALANAGVDLADSIVIHSGCGFGAAIHQALVAGCRWAVGLDDTRTIALAEKILFARGDSRFSMEAVEKSGPIDLNVAIPHFLEPQRGRFVFWCSSVADWRRLAVRADSTPWEALVVDARDAREGELEDLAARAGGAVIDLSANWGSPGGETGPWRGIVRSSPNVGQ
jgi:hypothetical protein